MDIPCHCMPGAQKSLTAMAISTEYTSNFVALIGNVDFSICLKSSQVEIKQTNNVNLNILDLRL